MKKETRIAISVLFVLLMAGLLLIISVRPVYYSASQDVENLRREIREQKRIIHAGGALRTKAGDEVIYTNSLDALLNMYDAGYRFCEIDIRETSDAVLICAHGDKEHLANGSELPTSASSQEFEQAYLFGEFTTMTVDMLTAFMREHPDLIIITDAQGNNLDICRKLAELYPDLQDRFIIQIYHEREYDPVHEMGFRNLIYTLYRADDFERNLWRIAHFAETHELVGITMQKELFYGTKNRVAMAHCGVPFMFHTVDREEEIERMLQKPFVLGVYTDMI